MIIPEKEIEKVCTWASRVVYVFKLNVSIVDMPESEFAHIRRCWVYGDYLLCPDRWSDFDRVRNIKGLTFLGQIECK